MKILKNLAFFTVMAIAISTILTPPNLRRLDAMIETIKAVPGIVILYVVIASLVMIFFVLEGQRAYNFLIDKHHKPYQSFWDFKYQLKFLNGWRSERLSKIAYLMIIPIIVSLLLLFFKRRVHEFSLTHFVVNVVAASLIFPFIALFFYFQEFHLPKFKRRTSAVVYIILMGILVLLGMYYVYYSDYGIYSFRDY